MAIIKKIKNGIIFGKSRDWSPGIKVRPKPYGAIKKIAINHNIFFSRFLIII